jgi:hypothetical protein
MKRFVVFDRRLDIHVTSDVIEIPTVNVHWGPGAEGEEWYGRHGRVAKMCRL